MTLPPEPEAHLQRKVLQLARLYGYRAYHTHRSDRSEPGFPDLVLVKMGGRRPVLFCELKAAKGKLSPAQLAWIEDLVACEGYGALAYVWRPADLTQIAAVLGG